MSYLRIGVQTLVFAALLPVYSAVWIDILNRLEDATTRGEMVDPFPFMFKLELAFAHWRYLDFPRPHEALFAIAASATTVFVVSVLVWWYL